MAKDFASMKNSEQIRKLLRVLGQDFTMSQMTNWRKGGIIGLAATAMALGKVHIVLICILINTPSTNITMMRDECNFEFN
jgi:vacuole morphology and inheritance protein 14